jgi:hypothetical protein
MAASASKSYFGKLGRGYAVGAGIVILSLAGLWPQESFAGQSVTRDYTLYVYVAGMLLYKEQGSVSSTATLPDDPFADFSVLHDNGMPVKDGSGAFAGSIPFKTTDVGGGAGSSFNLSKQFDLAANQTLSFNGFLRYDAMNTTVGASALSPGLSSLGAGRTDLYSFLGMFTYRVGDTYFGIGGGTGWGKVSVTDNIDSSTASFGVHTYTESATVGHIFTLFDSIATAPRSASPMPTKAAPPPAKPIGGYAIHLDLSASVDYQSVFGDSFTDSLGDPLGETKARAWFANVNAQLYARIIDGSLTWRPFVDAGVGQQFGFAGSQFIPAQFGAPSDSLLFGSSELTVWNSGLGIEALDPSGWIVGAKGTYRQSSEFNDVGGQLYVRYLSQPRSGS